MFVCEGVFVREGTFVFHDVRSQTLRFGVVWPDKLPPTFTKQSAGTAPPADIVVPTLANMIEIEGTQAMPVTNITISGR
jgi:hypothetical protein